MFACKVIYKRNIHLSAKASFGLNRVNRNPYVIIRRGTRLPTFNSKILVFRELTLSLLANTYIGLFLPSEKTSEWYVKMPIFGISTFFT